MGGGELVKHILGKKADTGAEVERQIVFFVLNLAGNLDQAILRIDLDLAAGSAKMICAWGADRKLAAGKINQDVIVAKNAGGQVDLDVHSGGQHGGRIDGLQRNLLLLEAGEIDLYPAYYHF